MAEGTVEFAYTAAIETLKRQDGTLTSLRNRAAGILSAAALVSAFASGVGLISTDPNKGEVFPTWAAWGLLAVLIVIAVLHTAVLWPVRKWQFSPNIVDMLSKHDGGTSADGVRRAAIEDVLSGAKKNKQALDWRYTCYRWSAALLVGEVLIVVSASAVS